MSKQENNKELLFVINPVELKGLFNNGEFIGTKDLIDCSNNENLKNFVDKNTEYLETKDVTINLGIDKATSELVIDMRDNKGMVCGTAYRKIDGEVFDSLGEFDYLSDAFLRLLEITMDDELKTNYIIDLLKSQIAHINLNN